MHAFWQPSWSRPEHRSPSRSTTSSPRNARMLEPAPDVQTFTTLRETRNLFPQCSIISGMNGSLSSVPSRSSVARISSGALTSTKSPGKSLAVICAMCRSIASKSGSELFDAHSKLARWCCGRSARQPDKADKFVPRLHRESQWPPHRFAHHGDLSKRARDVPRAGCSGRKETDVACSESRFFAVFIDHEGLARNHDNGFVLLVVPVEAPRGALPHKDVRNEVVASHQHLAPRFRFAAQHRIRRHHLHFTYYLNLRRNSHYNCFGHAILRPTKIILSFSIPTKAADKTDRPS